MSGDKKNWPRRFSKRISLHFVLVVPFALQTLGAVVLVGYLSYRSGQQAVEELAYQLMENTGQQVAQELNHYLQSAHEFNQRQIAAISSGVLNLQNLDQLHRYLLLQHKQAKGLTTLLFASPQGDLRVSHRVSPRDYGVTTQLRPEELPFEAAISEPSNPSTNRTYSINEAGKPNRYLETIKNLDARDRPWYRQAVTTRKAGWTSPFQIGSTSLLALNAYAPFYDRNNQLQGVFAVNISLNQLSDFLAGLKVGQSGEVFIIERNGWLIADSTPEDSYSIAGKPDLDGTTEPGIVKFKRRFPSEVSNPRIQQTYEYLKQRFNHFATLRSFQSLQFTTQGRRYFVTIAPYNDAYGLDWLVVTVIPESDLTTEIQRNTHTTALLCLLTLGLSIASGWLTAHRFTRRIDRLNRVSQELASGNLSQRLPADSGVAEVRKLAQSFNQMADQLQQSFDRLKDALEESEDRFTTVFRTCPDPIAIIDLSEGRFLEVNHRLTEFYGYSREEMVGQTALELGLWVNRAEREQFSHQLESQGHTYNQELTTRTKAGDTKVILISAEVCDLQEQAVIILVIRDINDRKQLENALQRSESESRTILNSVIAAIASMRVFKDGNWQIDQVSAGGELISGYTAEELTLDNHLWVSRIDPEDWQKHASQVFTSIFAERTHAYEYRLYHRDGSLRWISQTNNSWWDEGQQCWMVTAISVDITDRKLAEAALQASEMRFRMVVEYAPDVFVIYDRDRRLQYVNGRGLERTGWPLETFLGKRDEDLFPPEVTAEYLPILLRTVETRMFQMGEATLQPPSQEPYTILVKYVPILDEQGEIQQIFGITSDITHLKQTERQLRESKYLVEQIMDCSPQLLYIFDVIQGCNLYVNRQSMEILGYTPEEIQQQGAQFFVDILHPEDLPLLVQNLRHWETATDGDVLASEYRLRHRDGSWRWLRSREVVFARDEQGRVTRILGNAQDITDRKQSELELQRQKDLRETIYNEATDALFLVDPKTLLIMDCNQRAVELFEVGDKTELIGTEGRHLQRHPFTMKEVDEIVAEMREKGYWSLELEYLTRKGNAFWGNLAAKTVQIAGQSVNLVRVTDISDRKQAEQDLQQAKEAAEAANLAKSVFLANMSHELRTPLNAILGFSQLMQRSSDLSSDHQEYLQLIYTSGRHLLKLINEILDLSKIEAGRLTLNQQVINLFDELQRICMTLGERISRKNLYFRLEFLPAVPQYVWLDEQKLEQILLNLLSNAIKFTKQGGITLRVGVAEWECEQQGDGQSGRVAEREGESSLPHPPPAASPQTLYLRFEVEDTGIGIAPQDFNLIFEAFAQTLAGQQAQEGTGLGLTISRRLVQIMGGEITVQSAPDQGSTFGFTIPVEMATGMAPLPMANDRQVSGLVSGQPECRILAVDDQAENRLLLVKLLAPIGFSVREADTGEAALACWQTWHPHLIWMDIRLPDINGYEVTRRIRELERANGSTSQPPALPTSPTVIIALTAQALPDDRNQALAAGCNDYMSKPFQEDILFHKIAEHLGVQYRYTEVDQTLSEEPQLRFEPLTAADLAVMPHEWITELHQAALLCKDKAVQQLLQQIPPEQPSLLRRLENLAYNFEFEQIMEITAPYGDTA